MRRFGDTGLQVDKLSVPIPAASAQGPNIVIPLAIIGGICLIIPIVLFVLAKN